MSDCPPYPDLLEFDISSRVGSQSWLPPAFSRRSVRLRGATSACMRLSLGFSRASTHVKTLRGDLARGHGNNHPTSTG